ncbi:MAG: nucleoside monophosphate kinase [Dehalococcoidia bacterium]
MFWKAVLVVGPTGAGKTPLGQMLQKEGLWGRACLHFDFGEALRASAAQRTGQLTPGERDVVERSLRDGTLLEDEHFPIAGKLLADFLARRDANGDTLVVLNGLPRHIGQAGAMEAIIDMQALLSLECEPATVWERIRLNAGGDRGGRADDTPGEVERRVEVFRGRTEPLLRYYRERGVPVLPLDVGIKTTAQEIYGQLEPDGSGPAR